MKSKSTLTNRIFLPAISSPTWTKPNKNQTTQQLNDAESASMKLDSLSNYHAHVSANSASFMKNALASGYLRAPSKDLMEFHTIAI
jgi:hypothetical protein